MRRRLVQSVVLTVVLLGAVAFLALVWPTPYARIPVSVQPSNTDDPLRILGARENRFTGHVQWLISPVGWVEASEPPPASRSGDELDSLYAKYGAAPKAPRSPTAALDSLLAVSRPTSARERPRSEP